MKALDLRHVLKGEIGLLSFVTKAEATRAATTRGWKVGDVSLAANRFCEFWIICQCLDSETLRVLTHDGTTEVEYRGYR